MIRDKINSLNPMQKEAVLTTEGPLLVLAGAGSGKTRVLTHRIAYLIDELNVRPFNILAITFTNKAAKEMKERVEKITERGNEVWVSTFHSTCVRILRREIDKLGYSNNFTIYDADDSEKLIKEIMAQHQINTDDFNPKSVLSQIGRLKDELITPLGSREDAFDYRSQRIAEIYESYQGRLKANNSLDFDDLIFKTVELFSKYPNVLEKYQDRFRYIMVDEYQDSNLSQYQLVKLLSEKYNNICVVGDDDQSIYGWRGANIKNILNFENDFENATVIKLEQNYRSTKSILETANTVIKKNLKRKSKTLWTENKDGDKITFKRLNSDIEEAKFIMQTIKTLVNKGKASYGNFAVLYRNNALSRLIEEKFIIASVPYRLVGGQNFYQRKEIKDVIAYLKVIYNPDDDIAIRRIINVPKRGIGNSTVDKVMDYAISNGISFYSALSIVKEIPELKTRAKKLSDFFMLITELSNMANEVGVVELLNQILDRTGYLDELKNEGTDEALNRADNVQELINKAVQYETDNDEENLSLAGFLEEISLVADIDSMENDDNKVTLMTLHSSKGLEFPYVFISGFEEGIFPSYRASLEGDGSNAIEEERRLCYVGITRAKEKLFITCAKSRFQYGQPVYNSPSRFYKDLPSEYIDDENKNSNNTLNKNIIDSNNVLSNTTGKYRPKTAYTGGINSYNKPNIPVPKNITLDYEVGDMVRQMKFGIGTVVEINPAGADFEITVEFEKVGRKKMMSTFAKLKKI